jgi:hypothetical protein
MPLAYMFPLSQRLLARLTFGQVFYWTRPEDIISKCGEIEVVDRSTHVGLVPEGLMRGRRPKEWPSGRSVFLLRRRGKARIPPRGGTMLEELTLTVTYTYTTTIHGMPTFTYLENIIKLLSAVIIVMEFWSLPGSSGGVVHG